MLTLSPGQVEQVLRASTREEAGLPGMLGADQLSEIRERRYRALLDDRRLSRSLLAGLLVLTCFPPGGGELGIADLARRLDMRTSTIHRYVSTLLAAGLLERDPVSRQYRLAQQ
jgi:DNA-binding MarR family transcriptional regulator